MRGEEGGVVDARFARSGPRQDSLLDVRTLRRICMPRVTTNRNRFIGSVWILLRLRHGRGVLCIISNTPTRNQVREATDQVAVILDLDLSVVLVNGWEGVMVLLAARRSRDNR